MGKINTNTSTCNIISCTFNPDKNTPSEIALGNLTYDMVCFQPASIQGLTFKTFIETSPLKNLIA